MVKTKHTPDVAELEAAPAPGQVVPQAEEPVNKHRAATMAEIKRFNRTDCYTMVPRPDKPLYNCLKEPDRLWDVFADYVRWIDEHPTPVCLKKTDDAGLPHMTYKPRLLTITEFCIFAGFSRQYFHYKRNMDHTSFSPEAVATLDAIAEYMITMTHNIASAESGNPGYIKALLQISDKKEVTVRKAKDDEYDDEKFKMLLDKNRKDTITLPPEKR